MMEKRFKVQCDNPDRFRYWLERQAQDADLRTFPMEAGHFSLEWPSVESAQPLYLVMDGMYTREHPQRARGRMDSQIVTEVITFRLRDDSDPWMELVARLDTDMPAVRTYFEHLLEALERDWVIEES